MSVAQNELRERLQIGDVMTWIFAMLSVVCVAVLLSTSVQAERIEVDWGVGSHLIDACAQSTDVNFVSTNKGTYRGCCSKSLGYCILCSQSGKCYKFSHMRNLTEVQKDFAPDGNLIADDKPVRPSRINKKVVPNSMRVIE